MLLVVAAEAETKAVAVAAPEVIEKVELLMTVILLLH